MPPALPAVLPRWCGLLCLAATFLLGGCAGALRNYDQELDETLAHVRSGRIDQALKQLEANNAGGAKDLLYFLEKGELLRQKGALAESRDAWLQADEVVRAWEAMARNHPQQLLEAVGAWVVNDRTRHYEGQDYEKVLLSARLALNHVALGRWDAARIEVTKLHQREALIAGLRAREVDELKARGEENRIRTQLKDLRGYPVEIFDDEEVIRLRNGYQNAFGHYLAGFIYEALGEPGLAAAGYRQAIELRPGLPFLDASLAGLDQRFQRQADGRSATTDVLFVVESGMAPALKSVTLPLPVPTRRGLVLTPASFPVLQSDTSSRLPAALRVGHQELAIHGVTNVDAQARRALQDQMPGIIVRSTLRALAKGVMQSEVQKRDNTGVASLAMMLLNFATEQADERSWRSLPARIGVARAQLPPGRHRLSLGGVSREIEVGGRHALVALRQYGDSLTVLPSPPSLPPSGDSPLPVRSTDPTTHAPVVKTGGKMADSPSVKPAASRAKKSRSARVGGASGSSLIERKP